jgi:hypothetical protein
MLVSSPGTLNMRTKLICPAVSISIKGLDFPSNLIQCTKKAVRLTKKDGTTVEFVAIVQADQACMLSQMKVTALEEILVVQEYPDVFPEELLGMPPDCDIEFLIELLPGTPLISKRPYRIPVNELVELMKQLTEL